MKFLSILLAAMLGCGISTATPQDDEGARERNEDPERSEDRERRQAEGRRGPPPGERRFGNFLEAADTDRDGAVSREEFFALERIARLPQEQRNGIFNRFDKNGDGLIQKDELRMPPRPQGGRPPFPSLAQLDLDQDGAVSFAEFEQGRFAARLPADRRRVFFDRLDQNGDGKLSPEDQPQRRGPGGPGDGGSRTHPVDPERVFRDFDEDADGFLSFAEFRELPRIGDLGEDAQEDRFEKLDENDDLKISSEEFKLPGSGDRRGPKRAREPGRPEAGGGPAGR